MLGFLVGRSLPIMRMLCRAENQAREKEPHRCKEAGGNMAKSLPHNPTLGLSRLFLVGF